MPHLKVADALGVLTIFLVGALFLFGVFCIVHSIYFRNQIRSQGNIQLCYFSGPWIIRITYVLLSILWGFGEILRLSLLRCGGRLLNALSWKWQKNICKCHIVSNLGFMEPCLFLIVVFLLRASLQKSGTLNHKWNGKTACHVLLFSLPVLFLQLIMIFLGPKYNKGDNKHRLPYYFTSVAASPKDNDNDDVALCAFPLLSTICIGLFAVIVTSYLSWLGRRIVHLVINKGLQMRVYTLIISFSGFFPLRFVFLGLSVLSAPGEVVFEILAFLGFLSFLCCAGVGICTLVYFPVVDALALRNLQRDTEARRIIEEHNDTVSLLTNPSPSRNSGASTRPGSISFRTTDRDGASGAFVELSLFSPSRHSSVTPPDSPRFLGWPMLPHS